MPKLNVDIVTAERLVYSEQDVDEDRQSDASRTKRAR